MTEHVGRSPCFLCRFCFKGCMVMHKCFAPFGPENLPNDTRACASTCAVTAVYLISEYISWIVAVHYMIEKRQGGPAGLPRISASQKYPCSRPATFDEYAAVSLVLQHWADGKSSLLH